MPELHYFILGCMVGITTTIIIFVGCALSITNAQISQWEERRNDVNRKRNL